MQDSRADLLATAYRSVYNLSCNVCIDKRKETRPRHAEASQCISGLCLRLPVHYSVTLDMLAPSRPACRTRRQFGLAQSVYDRLLMHRPSIHSYH